MPGGAWHVLRDDRGLAGNEPAEMISDKPGIEVE
jgi:hypothetical protein